MKLSIARLPIDVASPAAREPFVVPRLVDSLLLCRFRPQYRQPLCIQATSSDTESCAAADSYNAASYIAPQGTDNIPSTRIGKVDGVVGGVGVSVAVGRVGERGEPVFLGEAAEGGVVVAGPHFVQPGAAVEVLAAVAPGVGGHGAVECGGDGVSAIGLVAVGGGNPVGVTRPMTLPWASRTVVVVVVVAAGGAVCGDEVAGGVVLVGGGGPGGALGLAGVPA